MKKIGIPHSDGNWFDLDTSMVYKRDLKYLNRGVVHLFCIKQ